MRHRRFGEAVQALVVSPSRATTMLDCSEARVYELIKSDELKSYKDGKSRKISVASIHEYVARKLAASAAGKAACMPKPDLLAENVNSTAGRGADGTELLVPERTNAIVAASADDGSPKR